MWKPIIAIVSSLGMVATIGCARLLPTPAPLSMVEDRLSERPSRLYVFLPGIADRGNGFVENGFFSMVRERGVPADLIAPHAHIGYYAKRIVLERLHDDVIAPARAAGYEQIWLVGISLGGLGSLMYASEYTEHVEGIVALAPYLGEPELIDEIAAAGGPRQWVPGNLEEDDFARTLWAWLRHWPQETGRRPKLFVLYGTDDRFAQADGMLAGLLPAANTRTIPGGHDWLTWKQLWSDFIEEVPH